MSDDKFDFKELQGLIENLHKAMEAFSSADSSYNAASRSRTNAMNELNQAQKQLQAGIDKCKAQAPRDSDWARQRTKRDESAVEG